MLTAKLSVIERDICFFTEHIAKLDLLSYLQRTFCRSHLPMVLALNRQNTERCSKNVKWKPQYRRFKFGALIWTNEKAETLHVICRKGHDPMNINSRSHNLVSFDFGLTACQNNKHILTTHSRLAWAIFLGPIIKETAG